MVTDENFIFKKVLKFYLFQHDIFGTCTASLEYSNETEDNIVKSYRDLTMCKLSHVNEGQFTIFSLIKSISGGHRISTIEEVGFIEI